MPKRSSHHLSSCIPGNPCGTSTSTQVLLLLVANAAPHKRFLLSYICKPLLDIIWLTFMVGRKKLDRVSLHARVERGTVDKLKEVAQILGYIYNEEGSTGQLLDAIASGELILIATKNRSDVDKSG